MITITITPKSQQNLYGFMVQKEVALRKQKQGTLHRSGPKHHNREKWAHNSFKGWIWFQRGIGGVVVATLQTKNPDDQWQLLTSFVGFLDRYLRDSMGSMNLCYGTEG